MDYYYSGSSEQTPTVQAAPLGSTKVGVFWNAVPGATNYVLNRSTNSNMSSPTQIYSGSSTNFLDTGRSATTTYYYQVTPDNTGASNIDSVTTLANATTIWWRAASAVAGDGTNIDSIPDDGNSGKNGTGTTTTRPTKVTLNGAPFMRFNQSSLSMASLAGWSGLNDYYAVVVSRKNQNIPSVDAIGSGLNATAGNRALPGAILAKSPSNIPLQYAIGYTGGTTLRTNSGPVPGMLHVVEYIWQEPVKGLTINGISDNESGGNTVYAKTINASTVVAFGGSASSATTDNTELDVAEIFFIQGTHSQSNRDKIRNFFMALYPSTTHPNFYFAPNGKTRVNKVDENVVLTTTLGDPFDYVAFTRMCMDDQGVLHCILSYGPNHNSSDTQVVRYMKSVDKGYTWTTPVTLFDKTGFFANPGAGTGHANFANHGSTDIIIPGGICFTSTGRLLVGVVKMRGTGLAQRERYFIYSDDRGSTFAVTTGDDGNGLFTDDYVPTTGQVTGVSSPIEIDGVLYTAVYGRTGSSGFRESALYKSTDDGMTWTRVSVIYPAGVNEPEEPELVHLGQGMIGCLIRSDTVQKMLFRFSWPYTNYSEWTTADIQNFASVGSNGAAINPNTGGIMCLGRYTSGANTLVNYSGNRGQDWTQSENANSSNWYYIYGNPIYDDYGNVSWDYITIHAEENGLDPGHIAGDGPTRVVCSRWVEA